MTTSLAGDGLVSLVPALAIMLGANVGTTLIVQVLSFNVSAVAPAFFVVGVITFRAGGQSLTRAIGRIAIGLGLTLLALHILIDTLAPAEQAPLARALFASITARPRHVYRDRCGADLGGAFERRGRAAGNVGCLFAFRHRRRPR